MKYRMNGDVVGGVTAGDVVDAIRRLWWYPISREIYYAHVAGMFKVPVKTAEDCLSVLLHQGLLKPQPELDPPA